MKKEIILTLLFFLIFKISFSQKKDIKITIKEATEAFDQQDYETAVSKIEEIKIAFGKNDPPPFIFSLEILAKSEVIKNNPYDNYALISKTKILATKYLKSPSAKQDANYKLVVEENYILNSYPTDFTRFNAQKEFWLKEEAQKKKVAEKNAELQRIKARHDAIIRDSMAIVNKNNARLKFIGDSIMTVRNAELARTKAIEDQEKRRLEAIRQAKADKITLRKFNFRNKTFSNLGFKSGEIAKYGLLYEHGGGKHLLGFHISLRTSLIPEKDFINGNAVENRNEFDLGPSFKLSNNFYLNLGGGYGFYNYAFRNDYTGQSPSVEMVKYLVTSGGLTIRLGRLINISAGASFMDIDKGLYTPEITGGLTFNLKSK